MIYHVIDLLGVKIFENVPGDEAERIVEERNLKVDCPTDLWQVIIEIDFSGSDVGA